MAVEIRVPEFGESILEATVGKWLKKEGETVLAGESLVELETEKVNVDVEAERDGVLAQIVKQQGETVHVGEVLGRIEEGAAGVAHPTAQIPAVEKPTPPREAAAAAPVEEQKPVAPSVRRIAEEHRVDLARVEGTGPGGRVTKEDIISYLDRSRAQAPAASSAAPPAPAAAPSVPREPMPSAEAPKREQRVPMTRRRLTIARRLVEAHQTAAMLTTFNELDLSAVLDIRKRLGEAFKTRHGVRLGLMSFFTKATVAALKAFPMLNAEVRGDEIVFKYYYDIGIAVAAEEGLVVPVLRGADCKSFAEIEREIEELASRARENRLTLDDLRGGTFTITNGGVFGSLFATPMLNAPQVGILGMHKIEERPIAMDGQVVIRPMMYVALTYDHRIIDGREAVQFLVRVKQLIENPETLMLEA